VRSRLRWKILFFTVLLPVLLTACLLWTVNRSVSDQVNSEVQERLERSSQIFEHMLALRSRRLAVTAGVIVQDPRFVSILSVQAPVADEQYLATVRSVARDYCTIARTDLFEVLDRRGRLLASVGAASSNPSDRAHLIRAALAGQNVSTVIPRAANAASTAPPSNGRAATAPPGRSGGRALQVTFARVTSGHEVVGVLIVGASIGKPLAEALRSATHSAVTFVFDKESSGSTLGTDDERALIAALKRSSFGHGRVFKLRASQNYLTLVRRIPKSDSPGRDFYVMQRSLDAETAFLPMIEHELLRLGILAALAAVLAGLFLAEHIMRPLKRLVRSAEEMERGNFDYPLQKRGRDEIGYLTDRFSDMRRQERVYVNSLQEVARLKSDFISVASHELRTPISIIHGYGELFIAGGLGQVSPEQLRAIHEIEKELEKLNRVADEATRLAEGRPPDGEDSGPGGPSDIPRPADAPVEGANDSGVGRPDHAAAAEKPAVPSVQDRDELKKAA